MSNTLRLEIERLVIRTFKSDDAYSVSYNSRRPRVAAEMADMILADEAVKGANYHDQERNNRCKQI